MSRWPFKPSLGEPEEGTTGVGTNWPGVRRWEIKVLNWGTDAASRPGAPEGAYLREGWWDAPTTRFLPKGDGVWLGGTLYAAIDSGVDDGIPWADLAEVVQRAGETPLKVVAKYEAGKLGVSKPRSVWERLTGVDEGP
jgi:hypothetical protein